MYTSLTGGLTNLKIGVSAYKDTGDTYVYKVSCSAGHGEHMAKDNNERARCASLTLLGA